MATTHFSGPLEITNLPLTVGDAVIEDLNEVSVVPQLVKLGTVTISTAATDVKLAVANPTSGTLLIHSAFLHVTTASSGAATADLGVAANATTASDTLMDGVDVGTLGFYNDQKNAGTNGVGAQRWTSSQFVTLKANADARTAVADLYAVISGLPA